MKNTTCFVCFNMYYVRSIYSYVFVKHRFLYRSCLTYPQKNIGYLNKTNLPQIFIEYLQCVRYCSEDIAVIKTSKRFCSPGNCIPHSDSVYALLYLCI